MPTIPLYDTTAAPDAWHRVTAPGGYEWWNIVAGDATCGIQIAIDFFDGDPFDAAYQLAYQRYLKHPTRTPPPVPRDCPGVRVVMNRMAGTNRMFGAAVSKGAFRYSEQPHAVSVGPSSLAWKSDRSLLVTLGALATGNRLETLEGELTLVLKGARAAESDKVRRDGRLVGVLRERCEGQLHTIELSGEAQYTHSFGTCPLYIELTRSLRPWHVHVLQRRPR